MGGAVFDLAGEGVGAAEVEADRDAAVRIFEGAGDFLERGLQAGSRRNQETGKDEELRHGRLGKLSGCQGLSSVDGVEGAGDTFAG